MRHWISRRLRRVASTWRNHINLAYRVHFSFWWSLRWNVLQSTGLVHKSFHLFENLVFGQHIFSWNNDPCWEDLNMTSQTGKIDHWDCFCPAWQRAQTHMITKLSVLIRTETEPTKGFSLNLLICAESSTNIKKSCCLILMPFKI